ncbi:up-regulator of cell proliferation-like [Pelobates cultripes]|uniref:Up-regulator of cell proliferation-like n=1 Tax=Pelobates cultripes TaxID=61616 RepID=A0AAD1SVY4_PELCU|nr:up-regulator of cell proliferation-like [Pelobates cultripes]
MSSGADLWFDPDIRNAGNSFIGNRSSKEDEEKGLINAGYPLPLHDRSTYKRHMETESSRSTKIPGVYQRESHEFAQLVSKLNMEDYRQTKLTLQDVLNIGQESMNDIELRTVEDIPWYFMQNVMALNVKARNTKLKQCTQGGGTKINQSFQYKRFTNYLKPNLSDSVHPRDVLCVLLNCSDHFLQQEIVTKMSMCQFAVPLLLPAGDGSDCTFMLWAMRDIVKKWTPRSCADSKSFMEGRLVNIPMPIFSFVRLGTCTLSKSKFLNYLLSPAHSHYSIFMNQDMDCGNYPRKVSDGLVEMSWFFPGGTGNSETFPEPFAVTNLHGDLESNWRQFTFLTQISAAVFIFMESFTERDCRLFTKFRDTDTNYFILIYNNNDETKEIITEVLEQLNPALKIFLVEIWDKNLMNLWITDVLTELDTKTGGQCRMRVISVLGVQSTGKSTLLNTMFGLQFPVASGQCTRGAFLTLIKVKENVRQELGCDFILVIDTEGLKAPELSSLEDSYEHDNELATLVVGLSDITIINMAMENMAEMKDTLQIVVHAFLRMSEVGKKPNCHLVHQNVSDVTAYERNMAGRTKLLKELNDMTKVAAEMEKRNNSMEFSNIIDYDPENHSWYIPGLWHGVPPMAPINQGYSENVFKLRQYIFKFIKERQSPPPQHINSFIEWIKSLWHAVKHETFIFSFRNILVAEAYDQLSMKYSELEWNFRKKVHNELVKYENIIKNNIVGNLHTVATDIEENDLKNLLDKEQENMTHNLLEFFKRGCANVHLVERYKEDFLIHVKCLRKDLGVMASSKCWEAFQIQNGKSEIKKIQDKCQQYIEEKVQKHLEDNRMKQCMLSERELKSQFDALWDNILLELKITRLQKHRIDMEMLEQLKQEMRNRPGDVTQKLHNVRSLKDYGQKLEITNACMDLSVRSKVKEFFTKDCCKKLKNIVRSLADNCAEYVVDKVNIKEDYNEMYCKELLTMINTKLNEKEAQNLHPTALFEVNLKLHILGKAAPHFQKMHDDFGTRNDPKLLLNKLKPHYFNKYKSSLQQDKSSRVHAQHFYEECLKPAIIEYIYKTLGKEIVDNILKSPDARRFNSQKYFQFTLLKELLEINRFENYLQYITQYENYVKTWISNYIVKKYESPTVFENLLSGVTSSITEKMRVALRDAKVQKSRSVTELLDIFSTEIKKTLVLSKSAMKITGFQNSSTNDIFSSDIEYFLDKTKKEIRTENFSIESILSNLTLKPQNELFYKIIGCGKKCPFCNAPCEAGGNQHSQHFASAHRPKGLAQYRWSESNILCNSICSIDVISNDSFINSDTDGKWHPYKDYCAIYPDWIIQPDRDMNFSKYWMFVLTQFNKEFAKRYDAGPAEIPWEWGNITKEQALSSLQESYHFK